MNLTKAVWILTLSIVLVACGSKVEKGSLEGRVVALTENKEQVFLISSIDLDAIISKSGAFEGALPEQYASTAKPYKEALYNSVNLEKSVFILLEGPVERDSPKRFTLLFEVKDPAAMKKEFKEVGLNLEGSDKLSTALNREAGLALVDNKIGMLVTNTDRNEMTAELLKEYVKVSEKKSENNELAEAIITKADVTGVALLDRLYGAMNISDVSEGTVQKMKDMSKDSYIVGTINFSKGQVDMEIKNYWGENMKKYLPVYTSPVSSEAISSLGKGAPIFALAMNMDFKKMIDNIYINLEESEKNDVDQAFMMAGGKEKVSNMFTGEMAFAAYKGVTDSDPIFNGFIGLNDAEYLKNLVNGFGPMAGMTTGDDGVYTFGSDAKMKLDNKSMIFSTSVEEFDQLLSAGGNKIEAPQGVDFGKHPISMFVDFTKLDPKDFPSDTKMFINELSYFSVAGDDNGVKAVLKSKNAEKNILQQLIELGVESINAKVDYNYDDEYTMEEIQELEEEMDEDWENEF